MLLITNSSNDSATKLRISYLMMQAVLCNDGNVGSLNTRAVMLLNYPHTGRMQIKVPVGYIAMSFFCSINGILSHTIGKEPTFFYWNHYFYVEALSKVMSPFEGNNTSRYQLHCNVIYFLYLYFSYLFSFSIHFLDYKT